MSNAQDAGAASCEVLVDPAVTPGYRFWERRFQDLSIDCVDTAIFVDLMLNYRAPEDSIERIRRKAEGHPDTQFLVIDHHQYEGTQMPAVPTNLQFRFTDQVYKCCFGQPSDLMVIASICDRDESPVRNRITDAHRRRAIRVSRAAADRRGLAGKPLVSLLHEQRWDILEALGQEDRQLHRTVRGMRPANSPASPALAAARLATA